MNDEPKHGADVRYFAASSPRSTQDDAARRLPKRFYQEASAREVTEGFTIELDGRAIKTPNRAALTVPTAALAQAIAAEWNALGAVIDPARLPLTKIANTAIDGVCGREEDVHNDIVRYIGNDLLFYRANAPIELAERQALAWDPVLDWFAQAFGAEFKSTVGIMPIEQNLVAVAKAASALANETAMALAALHVMTTLTGSALLTIAHLKGHLSVDRAWALTHIDEDWQIEHWGQDAEAATRRAARRGELDAAATFLALLDRRD